MPLSKRMFDLVATSLALILLSPLILILTILVRLVLGTPILFRQSRPGYKGKPFSIYKFRTMTDARDSDGNLLPDSARLTRFGQFMRSLSLDELPELFNILRGDMSVVGPRPLLMEYLPRYSPEQMRRHDVHPGLTGWAQVNGRNAITWPDKFKLDVWYVDHWSFWLDMKILLMSLWKVVTREGISQPGQVTTEYFMGNEESRPPRS
jgi:lipopolysaccharide/colanic/teichoic acid biosynthesis glycosyltransferase